jgi:hypothetical protein
MLKIFISLILLQLALSALTLPKRIYHDSVITPESDYPIYKQMREASRLFKKGNLEESTPLFIRVLLKAAKGGGNKNIDQYDYLYAHYAILAALQRDEKNDQTYIKLAKKILRYLDKATEKGIWEEGELGQFQMKVYKVVGNRVAELLYKSSKRKDKKRMKEALRYINKAQEYIRSESDFYIKETKAQILNALDGNPPLEGEEKITVTKIIKKPKDSKKLPQK